MWKTFITKHETRFSVVAAVSGCGAAFVGVLALTAWITGLRALASIRPEYIPMSPDTAFIFLLLGLILFFHVRVQKQREIKFFASAIVAVASIYGSLKLIEYFGDVDLTFESFLFPSTEKIGHVLSTRMSPVAGLLFFLSGSALQLKFLPGVRRMIPNIIGSCGAIIFIAGFVATTGYQFGTPLLYGGHITPLAATTAVGFLFLGCGVMALAGPETIFTHPFAGDSASARLLRYFLPTTIVAVLVQGFASDAFTTMYGINHALADALFGLAFAVFMSAVVIRLSKIMFQRSDRMEAERKRTVDALRESEDKFRTLFNNAEVGMFRSRLDGSEILEFNEKYLKILNYTSGEVKSVPSVNMWADKRERDTMVEMLNAEGRVTDFECGILNKQGEVRRCITSLRLYREKGVLEGSIQDITERKQAEQERQVVFEIIRSAATTANLDDFLRQVHQSLQKVLYAENCFVALYDQNTGLFSFPLFVDKFDPIPDPVSLAKSCTAYVFRSGKSTIITPAVFRQLAERNEVELVGSPSPSWIGVPLQTPAGTIGVLVLQHYEKENIYSERELRFLASVGSEVALVIERKRVEEAIEKSNRGREKLIKDLQFALDSVKTLEGLIPICSSCKKIRDDKGFWNQVEGYISEHTNASFTHGVCPECYERLYGHIL